MKKIFVIALIAVACILFAGCDSTDNGQMNNTGKQENSSGAVDTTSGNNDSADINFKNMFPDPNGVFKDDQITIKIDERKTYVFEVTGYADEEYDAFVSECKDKGFTNDSSESEYEGVKHFSAYSGDGQYYVGVKKDNGVITVTFAAK